ncbi:lycopene cyclase domain-containing protein [Halomicrobium sp. HM KBTZ05]|uniref:lycopene cyclase domain-containing protein n=1 Tax=Halomicrobium sp. HM KBTZ05 TaxID=3242663 RepID=UPI00355860F8
MAAFTYVQFHALFVLPALAVLVGVAGIRSRTTRSEVRPLAVAVIVAVAMLYTVPWDNYLILRGVWSYGTDSVAAVIWHAPIEEYLFILLQPLVAALWLHVISPGMPANDETTVSARDRVVGAAAGALVGLVGVALLTTDATFYLGAIVAWSGPVLALQWAVGWPYLLARGQTLVVAVFAPTAYLWIADRVALESGIWILSEQYTTGLAVLGLPLEEAAFFLVTNVFVVQGLLLYPWVIDRWQSR